MDGYIRCAHRLDTAGGCALQGHRRPLRGGKASDRGNGPTLQRVFWTLGSHDIVGIVEAPDDETLAAAMLMMSSQGTVRTTTLRAFSADEMRGVIAKAG
ncbi:MAG: GYD domain-containing protein [Solirubrobacterales bacterium]|nr:GYD domain-containing protein [Solirubrobacterales bacterium]